MSRDEAALFFEGILRRETHCIYCDEGQETVDGKCQCMCHRLFDDHDETPRILREGVR
jgi:hypothetical protein